MGGLRDLFSHGLLPKVVVGLTAVLLIAGAFAYARRPATLDPRVTMEQGPETSARRSTSSLNASRLAAVMDSEAYCLADRVGEATQLAFSSGVYLASAGLRGALPRDVQTLLSDLAKNGLLPRDLAMTTSAGTLVSARGSLSVRYRPEPLGVEIVSIPSKPDYGPALIVRFPDETSGKGEARLYLADRLQGVTVPAPFAPAVEVIALGWSPERLRSLK